MENSDEINKELDHSEKLIKNWKGFLKTYLKGNWEKQNMYTMDFLEIFHFWL